MRVTVIVPSSAGIVAECACHVTRSTHMTCMYEIIKKSPSATWPRGTQTYLNRPSPCCQRICCQAIPRCTRFPAVASRTESPLVNPWGRAAGREVPQRCWRERETFERAWCLDWSPTPPPPPPNPTKKRQPGFFRAHIGSNEDILVAHIERAATTPTTSPYSCMIAIISRIADESKRHPI